MRSACLAVCILITFGAAESLHAQQPAAASPDEDAIQETALAFVQAYDAGDAAAVAALWTSDGEYVVGQTTVNGQPAIQQLYEEFFLAHPGSKMEVHIGSIKVLAPAVAVEQGTASVTGSLNGPPSAKRVPGYPRQAGRKMADGQRPRIGMPVPPPNRDLQELAWLVGDWTAG